MPELDAVVVGAGPNGLAAAITLARAGLSVRVLEANNTIGGGCRSSELTLPGFIHDTCSTIHGLASASPFLRTLPLSELGVEYLHPGRPLAHPLDGADAALLERSLAATVDGLGREGAPFRRLMAPLVANIDTLVEETLKPIRIPRAPLVMARFAVRGVWPAALVARVALRGPRARALLAGLSSHSMLRLTAPLSAAFGLILAAVAQTYGWPVVRGGSQKLSDAMVKHLGALGAEVEVGCRVGSMSDVPAARCVLFDLTPRQVVAVAGSHLPARYRRALERFRYGPGVFKIDWALRAAIPWTTRECMRAGTLHLGGTVEEIARAEDEVWEGRLPDRPFVILVQPSGFDPGRAPSGSHTAWAYCHVPAGCPVDMTGRIEAQVERFAPGFREVVLARHTMTPAQMESDNANYVGGDINGGVQDFRQLFGRPAVRIEPYATPNPRLFLCSSSTPPGGGVHGMSGYLAARSALRRLRPLVGRGLR